MNNRPIGADYEDEIEDVLTPNHLTFGRRLETVSDAAPLDTADIGSNMWKRKRFIDSMLNHFWTRWRKEYLTSLRENQKRSKTRGNSRKVEINDIVIVHEDKQPRHMWKVGKVEQLIVSSDGQIRGVEVKLAKSGNVIKRPVNKLYPLVLRHEANTNDTPSDSVQDMLISRTSDTPDATALPSAKMNNITDNLPVIERVRRNAAVAGELRRKFGNT